MELREGGLEGEAEGGSASNAFRTFLSLTGTETNDGWRALAWFGAEGVHSPIYDI